MKNINAIREKSNKVLTGLPQPGGFGVNNNKAEHLVRPSFEILFIETYVFCLKIGI
jgi:hypothetical protein